MGATLEATLTVVGEEVMRAHSELHHYTDEGGLRGIVASNTLRATHFADLNDSTEIVHLRDKLVPELTAIFAEILRRKRALPWVNRGIVKTGGLMKSAHGLAEDLVQSLYQSAFQQENAPSTSVTASSPFVCSLCTHTTEMYACDNGLLSQWRGYGAAGRAGFCLVFDTQKLAQMLGREFDRGSYSHLNLQQAHYAFPDCTMRSSFPDLVATCEEFAETALKREPVLGKGVEEFFAAATLLKHEAFYEEREVRIVGIPMSERMRDEVLKEFPDAPLGPAKPILPPEASPNGTKRYIDLFVGDTEPLPIKRVIVGPRSDQSTQVAIAKDVSRGRFEVVASKTPLKR